MTHGNGLDVVGIRVIGVNRETIPCGFRGYLQADQHYALEETDSGLLERVKQLFDIVQPNPIVDEFGRALTNVVEMDFWTRHRDPQARVVHTESVLESSVESQIPVYVTNLKALETNYFVTTSSKVQPGASAASCKAVT